MKIISTLLISINTILLVGGGIYFSLKLRFPQLQWKKLIKGFKSVDKGISPLSSLMLSLAARIGVGSIAGIALAIYVGGPGTIFWIWIIGIITSINTFCESYLGSKYQEKKEDSYIGGPSYYMEKGLNNKLLAKLYALLIIIAYIFGFITIQANTITVAVANYYNISPRNIALVISIISFLSISKGLTTVIKITNSIVPIIGISYIILGLFIVIKNFNMLPVVLITILKSAWNIKSFISSFLPTLIIGIKRGAFSTESGLGTSSIATSTTYTKNKVDLGLMQILGVYFIIFIICNITAFIILTSNYNTLIIENINGIELMQYALNYHLGTTGNIVLILAIIFLAYSTIIAGYYYGESSLKYLVNNHRLVDLLKLCIIVLIFIGSQVKATILWNVVDLLVEILIILNMYTLLKLRDEIIFAYKNSK